MKARIFRMLSRVSAGLNPKAVSLSWIGFGQSDEIHIYGVNKWFLTTLMRTMGAQPAKIQLMLVQCLICIHLKKSTGLLERNF